MVSHGHLFAPRMRGVTLTAVFAKSNFFPFAPQYKLGLGEAFIDGC